MIISIATVEDLDAVNSIRADIYHDKTTDHEVRPEDSADSIMKTDRQITFIVTNDENISTGYITVHERSQFKPENEAEFELFVKRDFRGKGIGKMLLRAAIDYVSHHPTFDKLTLMVYKTSRAMGLYESFGFNTIGEINSKALEMYLDVKVGNSSSAHDIQN
ncbi:GNAT family N-acetyltransferase [Aliikangiella coralliicola]|uniref:GNAT family N-acetyltransferase n=1 Tax=Aliikangiella coralliicola TaxID=2592383 RepID=A0A545UD51_9GAMM|nr:GNAT family N-acetyltransferase [Aliikangiella coralliicola]TQV87363.1 GNAT family N-acetyltransferase [Aliikangiella coralliicola]